MVTVFFGSHDPTIKNGQGPDNGTQYRSMAFYTTVAEKNSIEKIMTTLNREVYHGKIVTEVTKFSQFYEAEAYHQNFELRNPNQRYIKAVSEPRLCKFKMEFPQLLKKEKE